MKTGVYGWSSKLKKNIMYKRHEQPLQRKQVSKNVAKEVNKHQIAEVHTSQ